MHHLGFSAVTALAAIAIGEITSPLQNVWFLFKTWRYDSRLADEVFRHLSLVYAVFYVLCRSVVGPFVVLTSAPMNWNSMPSRCSCSFGYKPMRQCPCLCLCPVLCCVLDGSAQPQAWLHKPVHSTNP